jgi:integrase
MRNEAFPRRRQAPGRRLSATSKRRLVIRTADVLPDIPIDPRNCSKALRLILDAHNGEHGTKHKGVSHRTMAERERFLFWFFTWMRVEEKYKMDARSLTERHVAHAIKRWVEQKYAPATIQTYVSFLRVFACWIGKAGMIRRVQDYVDDPALVRRSYSTAVDRGWEAAGFSFEEVKSRAMLIDVRSAAALWMIRAFGLRFKEVIMLRPRIAAVDDQLLLVKEGDLDRYLLVLRGAKGGRPRGIPIDTDDKRAALAFACSVVSQEHEALGQPGYSLKKAKRRLRHIFEDRLGVCFSDLGVVPHGLRHDYANERYERFAGQSSPVRGGPGRTGKDDDEARRRVAEELGHWRGVVANAYLGSSANPPARAADSDVGGAGNA